ncbi:guanine nucleotide exchange factor for Rab-3A-like isoform X2 [Saccostrea echinata]|uniref:guanine nucleotide exchange factor for Rab-3A-like isoform X2 n=1 Tax=Saccostrea echinata TaxID=191078 RepID=UPI002A817CAB|nr:guanine nucleotide exchange factor for Rab-3A-like isoform X2 [Saccostrea echinata]
MAGYFPSGAPDKPPSLDHNMNNNNLPIKQNPSPGEKECVFFVSSPSPEAIPSPISGSPILPHHPISPPLLQKIQSESPQRSPKIPHKDLTPLIQGTSPPMTVPLKSNDKLVAPSSNGGQRTNPKILEKQQALSTNTSKNGDDSKTTQGISSVNRSLGDSKVVESSENKVVKRQKNVSIATESNGEESTRDVGTDTATDSDRKPDLSIYRVMRGVSFFEPEEGDIDTSSVELRNSGRQRGELRHAMSEVLPNEVRLRKRSQTMAHVKEHAYGRLQEELSKAQEELKLKDEECEKLLKVRDQMGEELEELTASLFEEANNMVQDANIKRMHSEKLLREAHQQIEVLQAEVVALKQLVLTSTPASPNKHLHPQIATTMAAEKEKPKSSKPFWKTHRRSTSHHEFTKEARQEVEAQQEAKADRCKEIDSTIYEEFVEWRQKPSLELSNAFLNRMYVEDIGPCLNFSNVALAEKVKSCVASNSLTIEPIPGDSSYPRKCRLTENNKLCNYKIKLGEDSEWYSISQLCRNRIAAVCDFYTYIRYINQGLVKSEDKDAFYEVVRLRKKMALSRLGYS